MEASLSYPQKQFMDLVAMDLTRGLVKKYMKPRVDLATTH